MNFIGKYLIILMSYILVFPAPVHPSFLPPHLRTVLFVQAQTSYVSPEVITHFVRMVVIAKVEDYGSSWGLISLSRCIPSKRDTVLMQMSPLIQRKGDTIEIDIVVKSELFLNRLFFSC